MPAAITRGVRLKDRYLLERTLGRGGMAAVWLGHDEVLDRPVAVKVLSDTIASDPSFVARFRREALTAAGLTHPNLAGVYDFSDEGERPYLVMQLVPGETLAARFERVGRVDCDQLARELLDAVSHIHEVGILHRDIKPGNIILEPDGTAKLIDFGIALPADSTALTSTGLVLGTERYAAPEVLKGLPATERSDLYSCGLVLRACERQGSPQLTALIAAMTSEEPRKRPQSAAEALRQLGRPGVSREPATEVLVAPFEQGTERLPAQSRPDRRKLAVAILALLAGSAVAALIALGGGGDSPGSGTGEIGQARNGKGESGSGAGGAQSSRPAGSGESVGALDASGSDPARGSVLNEQAFAMIQAGEYEAAVPVLEEAITAFPAGTADLDYAYALFNLGNALRLSGRPEEAIPVLERRLEIPNQEAEVREELEAAYAEAG